MGSLTQRCKVNVDGSYSNDLRRTGFGCIIRDYNGSWEHGFSSFHGDNNTLSAKLHGIKIGFTQAWTLGHRQVILETDFLEAQTLVAMDLIPPFHVYGIILADIKSITERQWKVEVVHIFREAN